MKQCNIGNCYSSHCTCLCIMDAVRAHPRELSLNYFTFRAVVTSVSCMSFEIVGDRCIGGAAPDIHDVMTYSWLSRPRTFHVPMIAMEKDQGGFGLVLFNKQPNTDVRTVKRNYVLYSNERCVHNFVNVNRVDFRSYFQLTIIVCLRKKNWQTMFFINL